MAHQCAVAVLPTLHRLHQAPGFAHYDYSVLRRTALAFSPDVLCGEVRPEDWAATGGGLKDGYCGPSEYRECLLPLCREHSIPFVPIDGYDNTLLSLAERLSAATFPGEDELMGEVLRLGKRAELGVAAFLDPAVLHLLRAKHHLAQQHYPDLEGPTWDPRNLRMLANIMEEAARRPGGRMLVTVGLEHLPAFLDHLGLCPVVHLVPPSDHT